jgi:hypothetical protein
VGAIIPLLWIHVFRIAGGSILAPGAADPAVPADFRTMVGLGDMLSALLALVALLALRAAIPIIQSIRYQVFDHPLGVNWLIVTMYVPALLVSSVLIVLRLVRSDASARGT